MTVKRTHQVSVGTVYQVDHHGDGLSEELWQVKCSCGWATVSAFLVTAQMVVRSHLGLEVDWDRKEIEVLGKAD